MAWSSYHTGPRTFRGRERGLFREPDAGNRPVRFDEREQETDQAKPDCGDEAKAESTNHRETTLIAPFLDSTHGTLIFGVLERNLFTKVMFNSFRAVTRVHSFSKMNTSMPVGSSEGRRRK